MPAILVSYRTMIGLQGVYAHCTVLSENFCLYGHI